MNPMENLTSKKQESSPEKIARGENPYVQNLKLFHALDHFIRPDKLRGLRFLYGPQGSGKSTHIREYVSEHVSKGGHGVVLSGT